MCTNCVQAPKTQYFCSVTQMSIVRQSNSKMCYTNHMLWWKHVCGKTCKLHSWNTNIVLPITEHMQNMRVEHKQQTNWKCSMRYVLSLKCVYGGTCICSPLKYNVSKPNFGFFIFQFSGKRFWEVAYRTEGSPTFRQERRSAGQIYILFLIFLMFLIVLITFNQKHIYDNQKIKNIVHIFEKLTKKSKIIKNVWFGWPQSKVLIIIKKIKNNQNIQNNQK